MTANRFGGAWTADKLAVLDEYLGFYTQALKAQPFQLLYIDAFAGTGRCHVRDGTAAGALIEGSASRALNLERPFDRYHFIEPKAAHRLELQALVDAHPRGALCQLHPGTAQDLLPFLLRGPDWRNSRGVLFLDPFGLQCDWPLLQQVASTKALDVFFLLSLSGLYRQAAVQQQDLNPGHAGKLDRVFGTDAWRSALYVRRQGDLFGDDQVSRDPGWHALLAFAQTRLGTAFPYVSEPRLLGTANGAPLFALFFMVANPSRKARELAQRVSREILVKLR